MHNIAIERCFRHIAMGRRNILTRILCGEEVDASFLPCDYVRHFEDGTDAEVTKTSQAVA